MPKPTWQGGGGSATSFGGTTVTFNPNTINPVAAGDYLFVIAMDLAGFSTSVADSQGNSYTALVSDGVLTLYYTVLSASGSMTVTLTSGGGITNQLCGITFEYSNVASFVSNVIGVPNVPFDLPNSVGGSWSILTPPALPLGATGLVFAVAIGAPDMVLTCVAGDDASGWVDSENPEVNGVGLNFSPSAIFGPHGDIVANAGFPPLLGCGSPPSGTAGVPYNFTFVATSGISPYTYAIISGSLPTGLSMATNGVVSGTPTASGTFPFTVQATDSTIPTPFTVSIACSISIGGNPPTLACPVSNVFSVGTPYTGALVAAGGTTPYTFAITSGALPPGLTLNTSTGVISGTPTLTGFYSYTAKVTDANSLTATASCRFTPLGGGPSGGCPPAGLVLINQPYSSSVVAFGGVPPYTFALISGGLPTGLNLNTSTGLISGTPTAAGTFNYTIQITDANGLTATTGGCQTIVSNCPPLR